jgi:MoxR-like ATPase
MKNLNTLLYLCQESDNSVLLKGVHGIGKSERVEAYAKEKGYHCEVLFLSHQETGDLIGIPYLESGNTVWSTPIWLQRIYDAQSRGQKCVLFLDELNRARLDVRQSALQLVLCKQIHQHILPKDTLVVAAINPEDEYQVAELDPALNDRFDIVELKVNSDDWIEWARQNGVHESVISFVADNPDKLWFKTEAANDVNHPTPRSWVKISNFLKVLDVSDIDKKLSQSTANAFFAGKIGKSIGNQFYQFWKNRSDFNAKSVENLLKKVKDRTKDRVLVDSEVIKDEIQNVEVIKLNLVAEDLAKKYLTKDLKKLEPKDQFDKAYPLMVFLYSLPLEILHSTLKGFKDDEVKKEYYNQIAIIDSFEAGTLRNKELFRKIIDKMR